MKGNTMYEGEDLVVEIQDRVRHDAYKIDCHDVADALLRDVAGGWSRLTADRARALSALTREPGRRSI